MGLGRASGAHFLHDFSMKNVQIFNTLIDKILISDFFSISRSQTKWVIKLIFGQLMRS